MSHAAATTSGTGLLLARDTGIAVRVRLSCGKIRGS